MFNAAATATAASAALPPALNILWPAWAARGWVQATMPLVLCTTLRRLGKATKSGSEEGKMACALRGILRKSTKLSRNVADQKLFGDCGERSILQARNEENG